MSKQYNDRIKEVKIELHRILVNTNSISTCINCTNWENESCGLNSQRPPSEIIVYGCELHEFDVPF